MRIFTTLVMTALAGTALALPAAAKVKTGSTVPNIQMTDSNGNTHNLADFTGKTVVLEWTNHGCPFVKKHYDTAYKGGNMQKLQKAAAADDVVWLSIFSSAPGQQGHVTPEQANELTEAHGAAPAAVILDPSGDAGRTFSAKTTPHMFVIDANQTLVYQGAIDDKRGTNVVQNLTAHNYVTAALDALKAGQPIEVSEKAPYGCSVKYEAR